MKSMKEQLAKVYTPGPTVVRQLRCITSAEKGHGYNVDYYTEYSDGKIEFTRSGVIDQGKTGVRLRKDRSNVWEENVGPVCPGWFRCESPNTDS